jgi:hypothetical protein
MKKGRFVISFITFVFIVVGALLLRIAFDDQITARETERNQRATKYNEWVGEKVVLHVADTFEVISYNKWKNEFTLEDESKLSPKGVENLMIR